MDILVLSNSFMVRESIYNLIKKIYESVNIDVMKVNEYLLKGNLKKYDITIGHTYKTEFKDIKSFFELKDHSNKFIVLDQIKNENILQICIENDVDGYVTDFEDEYEFKYIINKIINGSKFYDSQLVQKLMGRKKSDVSLLLTEREKEVMIEVGKGYSNKEISEKLNITEFTVKKHLSKVMSKLNYRSRKDIIVNHNN
ncbi:MAG: response regulator transcription factor [Paraclostridium sp.]